MLRSSEERLKWQTGVWRVSISLIKAPEWKVVLLKYLCTVHNQERWHFSPGVQAHEYKCSGVRDTRRSPT